MSAPPDRILRWEGCHNVRDLGGLETVDGRRTRWGALIRSDILCRLTDAGRAALRAHGVRTVVDLRAADELASEPNPFSVVSTDEDGWPRCLCLPLNDDPVLVPAIRQASSPAEQYRIMLDGGQVGLSRIVSGIAAAPPGGVVVHCHAGKDRTGVVIAVLLSVVGVSDETIAADYALSGDQIVPLTREWLDRVARSDEERATLLQGAMPHPQIMLNTLTHLRDRYGGAERYLLDAGVSAGELTVVRDRLVEAARVA